MELTQIKVSAEYCFGSEPIQLANLAKVNFLYAPNGAGKTTISNALSQQPADIEARLKWPVATTDTRIRVFNESYRSKVLTEYIDGIFTIGTESDDVNVQIASLEAKRKTSRTDREALKNGIGSKVDGGEPSGLLGEIERERVLARDEVFELHKDIPEAVRATVFKGFRTNRESFFKEACERFKAELVAPKDMTWDAIAIRNSALTGDRSQRNRLPRVTMRSLLEKDEIAQLGASDATAGTGDLAALIQRLANGDWVSEGREHLRDATGRCPFCQQNLPENFGSRLAEYFAEGYDKALELATAISIQLASRSSVLSGELASVERAVQNESSIDEQSFIEAVTAIRTGSELVALRVDEKQRHPTKSIVVDDIERLVQHLNALIDAENDRVGQHNVLVADASAQTQRLIDDGWELFLTSSGVAGWMKRYTGIAEKKRKKIEDLEAEIAASELADLNDENEIERLSNSISNTAAVAERINELLMALGFRRFSLSVADAVAGGYRIIRADGSLAFDSLSEGEKSFLCFAYFLESLSGSTVAGGAVEPVIAIIDDPISSLDSDTLFIVAAYIRDLAKKVIDGEASITQLIVLTHNTQFHHEAAYTVNDAKGGDRYHYRLLKGHDGFTTVQNDGPRSKIRGSYDLLWQAVVDIAGGDDDSATSQVGVFNIARRIIEGYFKTVGSTRDLDREQPLSVVEERLVSMFLIWASSGSHTIVDGFAQSHDLGGTRRFLQLLQLFFDQQGHSAHFDMMVRACGGQELLETGSVFGRFSQ